MPSDIHIFVRFDEQCVFAGEELRCKITFRNDSHVSELQTPTLLTRKSSRSVSIGKIAAAHGATKDHVGSRAQAINNARSDKVPASSRSTSMGDASILAEKKPMGTVQPGHKHHRSVSIVSLNSPVEGSFPSSEENGKGQRVPMSHRRSSTIQVHTGEIPPVCSCALTH